MELKDTPEYKEALRIVNKFKMNNIPTAKEFLGKQVGLNERVWFTDDETLEAMIEFAKLHVTAALKAATIQAEAYNKSKFPGDVNPQVDMDSILNSYSLNNIK